MLPDAAAISRMVSTVRLTTASPLRDTSSDCTASSRALPACWLTCWMLCVISSTQAAIADTAALCSRELPDTSSDSAARLCALCARLSTLWFTSLISWRSAWHMWLLAASTSPISSRRLLSMRTVRSPEATRREMSTSCASGRLTQ
ncbi:hypothetical protein D3C78_1558540 [compost metagenome]